MLGKCRILLLTITGIFSIILNGSGIALADTTQPDNCDATPKYYCTHIDYSNDGYTASGINRWYEGAIANYGGNDVINWQRYWIQDYSSQDGGTTWNLLNQWGLGNYYNDALLSHPNGHWEDTTGGSDLQQIAMVVIRLRYLKRNGDCFCTQQLFHYLWSRTIYAAATSDCAS